MKYRSDCNDSIHPKAIEGLKLFNEKKFFEAHEELEDAWREETGEIRYLYQGVLQVAVTYLHITRRNYNGAIKVYERSMKWLNGYPDICRGIYVGKLRSDAENIIKKIKLLGAENIAQFETSLFQPVLWNEKRVWICDRCGTAMHEKNCKVTCPNCGNRFDCSDLNIYFD